MSQSKYPPRPRIVKPGPVRFWLAMKVLGLERRAFGKTHDPAHFSELWMMTVARDSDEPFDADHEPEITAQDKADIQRFLRQEFARRGYVFLGAAFLGLDVSKTSSGSRRTWTVRSQVR